MSYNANAYYMWSYVFPDGDKSIHTDNVKRWHESGIDAINFLAQIASRIEYFP